MAELHIRLFTHESIVHSQTDKIEKLLDRKVQFRITLNPKADKSNIQFGATDVEIQLICNDLGYPVYVRTGEHWIAYQ